MMHLQNSNWSYLAEQVKSIIGYAGNQNGFQATWNADLGASKIRWHLCFRLPGITSTKNIWQDEFRNFPDKLYPSAERTMQLLVSDSASKYYDDVTTHCKKKALEKWYN